MRNDSHLRSLRLARGLVRAGGTSAEAKQHGRLLVLVIADQVLYSQIVSPPSEFFSFEVIS
jgi:hypothetical protein